MEQNNLLVNAVRQRMERGPKTFAKNEVEEIIQSLTTAIVKKENICNYDVQLAVFDPVEVMKTIRNMQTQHAINNKLGIKNALITKSLPVNVIASYVIQYLIIEALNYTVFNEQNIWEIIGAAIEDTLDAIGYFLTPTIIKQEARMYCTDCGVCYQSGMFDQCPINVPGFIATVIYNMNENLE